MGRRNSATHDPRLRQLLAQEAARVIAESGLRDFAAAKQKAAANLRVEHTRNMPTNQEIEEALFAYQRLFRSDSQPAALLYLRKQAIAAMRLLERFQPRLVGPVLSGSADENSPVNLHLFANTAEEVGLFLLEQRIPFESSERRLRTGARQFTHYPLYRFVAGDSVIELTIFPVDSLRQAPYSPVDGRPMQRADLADAESLLKSGGLA